MFETRVWFTPQRKGPLRKEVRNLTVEKIQVNEHIQNFRSIQDKTQLKS